MTDQWVVILRSGDRPDDTYVYGPLTDKDTASRFADFLTTEVDPARAYALGSPLPELLFFWNRTIKGQLTSLDLGKPEFWPPKPGQVWQDRNKDRWVCAGTNPSNTPYLVCIARQADDSAEEILRQHGPMTLVHSFHPTEEECPF